MAVLGSALVAAVLTAFNDPGQADMRLHLSTAVDQPPAKRPRKGANGARKGAKGAQGTAPCVPSHARSYYAYALMLSAQSAYFKVESAEAEVLLRALHLADRFLVNALLAQLLASRLVPGDAITANIAQLAMAFSERSDTAVPLPKEFLAKCDSRHPAVVFHNVPKVVTTPDRLARFCFLSHAAVLVWTAAGTLKVYSENDVAYLLSEWVKAQKKAGRPCSTEQLEQLAQMVRVSHCGQAYLQFVLPALDWFKSGRTFLSRFALFRGLKDAGVEYPKPTGSPDAWTASPREQLAECEAVVEWTVSAEQLEALEAGKRIDMEAVFLNGFWMMANLQRWESKTAPGEYTLGYFANVNGAKTTKAVSWSEQASVAFSCLMELGKAAKKGPIVFACNGSLVWGYHDALSTSATSVAALVAPHLEGGQLKGKVTFSDVDLLGRRA